MHIPSPSRPPAPHDRSTWSSSLGGILTAAGGPWGMAIVLALVPYLVARGWINAMLVVMAVTAIWRLSRHGGWGLLANEAPLRWLALALAMPIFLVAVVQLAHGQATSRPFDAPLRLLLAACLLVLLYARRVNWLDIAGSAFALASLASAASIYAPGTGRFYWEGGRAANYFVDPLSLAQHSALLAFLCLFCVERARSTGQRLLLLAGFIAGLSVAVSSGSKTGWTMVPLLALLWLLTRSSMQTWRSRLVGLALLLLALTTLCLVSDTVSRRLAELGQELQLYVSGRNPDTSTGIRISLFRTAWEAFLARPLTGWGFTYLPTPADLPSTASLWTPMMTSYFVNNGTHNEWLQAMMRMGVAGLLARGLMYFVPLAVFVRAIRSGDAQRRQAGLLGLSVIIAYLTAGISSEVSNLIYLSSFYGLMVAGLGAVALPPPGTSR